MCKRSANGLSRRVRVETRRRNSSCEGEAGKAPGVGSSLFYSVEAENESVPRGIWLARSVEQ